MSSPQNAGKTNLPVTVHYSAIQALFNTVMLATYGFLSVYLRSFGFTDAQIGIVLSCGTALSILLQPAVGSIADRHPKVRINLLLCAGYAFVMVLCFLITRMRGLFLPIAVIFILMLFIMTAWESLTNSLGMGCINLHVKVDFGIARAAGSAGYAIASVFLGRLVEKNGAAAGLFFAMLFSAVSILCLIPFRSANSPRPDTSKDASRLTDVFRKRPDMLLLFLGVAVCFYSQMVRGSYMYQITLNAGGREGDFGLITAFTAFMEVPSMALFSVILKRFRAGQILLFSAVFMVIRTVAVALVENMTGLYIAQSLQMLSYALFVPSGIYYVNEIFGEADRNKGHTLLGASMSLSSILASLSGGMMLTLSGGDPKDMLLFASAVASCGIVLLFLFVRKNPGTRRKE